MIHAGSMMVWIDQQVHYAGLDSISILFPGHEELFVFSKTNKTRHSYIHIALPDITQEFSDRLHRLPRKIPLSTEMNRLTKDMLTLRRSPLSTTEDMLKTTGIQMLWRYIGEAENLCGDPKGTPPQSIVECAQRYVESNLRNELCLDSIAEAVAVSPAHLIRVFRIQSNKTPVAYLWERRTALGIELLEQSGLSVSIISERCGFKTRNHFSRRIRQATGLSPIQVRKKAWKR
jgi:AraC family transcriptional regulator of arabinose operon